jgi:hypothetical protein
MAAPAGGGFGRLPLSFEPTGDGAFLARGAGHATRIESDGMVAALKRSEKAPVRTVAMRVVGARRGGHLRGAERLRGTINRIAGRDRGDWRVGISTFEKVRRPRVYDGIDLVWHGSQDGLLEYDFDVAPGADPQQIALAFDGVRGVEVGPRGDLLLKTREATLRQRRPVVYQRTPNGRHVVDSRYQIDRDGRVRFALGDYDHERPLVIDPVLEYSTYLGGSGSESLSDLAVDATGATYVTGYTLSPDWASGGTLDAGCGTAGEETCDHRIAAGEQGYSQSDAWVAKVSPDGSALEYATYLGGSDEEHSNVNLAVDASGNAYLAGTTDSRDFPVTDGAFRDHDPDNGSDRYDIFVAKLDPTGGRLLYSTYLGGYSWDTATGIAVDPAGAAYVAAQTSSSDWPGGDEAHDSYGLDIAAVAKLDPTGSSVVYSKKIGGDTAPKNAIAVDATGAAYLTGTVGSTTFPTTLGAYDRVCGNGTVSYDNECEEDAWVAKLRPDGGGFVYATYLGGAGHDTGRGITVDELGNAYVIGTAGTGFPTFYRVGPVGTSNEPFVAKLDQTGSALLWSTQFGGSAGETPSGLAVDVQGRPTIVGATSSIDFPVSADTSQQFCGGGEASPCSDAFALRLTADGRTFDGGTYLGGKGAESAADVGLDPAGNPVVGGTTSAPDMPTVGALQEERNGGGCDDRRYNCPNDGWLAKIDWAADPATVYDDFRDARRTRGIEGGVVGDSTHATHEPGEPDHVPGATRSTWFTWTAQIDRRVTFDTAGSTPGTQLAVYRGDRVDALTAVAGPGDRASFDAVAGSTYRIAADGPGGPFALSWRTNPPANDAFAAATEITGSSGSIEGSSIAATRETGERSSSSYSGPTVWYRWRAPSTGRFRFSLPFKTFDGAVSVYRGDSVNALSSVFGYDVTEGAEYRIAVAGYYSTTTGDFRLAWEPALRPANDDLAAATPIDGESGSVAVDTVEATKEIAEPAHGSGGGRSVWYRWTVPETGVYDFGSDLSSMTFYRGTSYGMLTRLGSFISGGGRIALEGGDVLSIAVYDQYWGLRGTMRWARVSSPDNDFFADARPVGGEEGRVIQIDEGSTREYGEPTSGASVWYRWVAPSSGPVWFQAGYTHIVHVFTGDSMGALAPVATSPGPDFEVHRATFDAVEGTEYRIALARVDYGKAVALRWNQHPPPNDGFANARQLDGRSGTIRGDNAHATTEPGEPASSHQRSVWFNWTAPRSGDVLFHARGSSFDTTVGVYTGERVDALTQVGFGGGSYEQAAVSFRATGGRTYRIRLGSYESELDGRYVLNWNREGGDDEPPYVELTEPEPGAVLRGYIDTIRPVASDNVGVDRIEYEADGLPIPNWSDSIDDAAWSTTRWPDGPTTFTARAFDEAGNSAEDSVDVWIDNTPPDSTIDSGPVDGAAARAATFSLSASEAGATFECALDRAYFQPCTATPSFVVSEGRHSLRVRATDPAGNVERTASRFDWVVTTDGSGVDKQALPENLERPSVDGEPVDGSTLRASRGHWRGAISSYSYQWRRCDHQGMECEEIPGATDETYAAEPADGDRALRVYVTATGPAGMTTAASTPTSRVRVPSVPTPENITRPTVTGTAERDGTLVADPGTWSGSPTRYSYQWKRCDSHACYPSGTGRRRALDSDDLYHRFLVEVTATNAGGDGVAESERTAWVGAAAPENRTRPTITGQTVEGETLQAEPGSWSEPATFGYQWLRCDDSGERCLTIPSAYNPTYKLGPYDAGQRIVVRVTARGANNRTSTAKSDPTAPVAESSEPPGTPTLESPPTISGEPKSEETLTGSAGSWTGSPTSYSYQWLQCGTSGGDCWYISGATGSTYKLTDYDVGYRIMLRVIARNAKGEDTAQSDATAPVKQSPPRSVTSPVIHDGGDEVGTQRWSAEGMWTGRPSYSRVWLRCDADGAACEPIPGATSNGHVVETADVGHRLRIRVTATNSAGTTVAESAPTTVMRAKRVPPKMTARPTISGETVEGSLLTGDVGAWSGDPTSFTYSWRRCTSSGTGCSSIAGATGNTYRLTSDDVGQRLTLVVTAANADGSAAASSVVTNVITAAPKPPSSQSRPTVGGDAVEGSTLTAGTGTWDGSPTGYDFQWRRCGGDGSNCADIAGATAPSYVLAAEDVGHRLVARVTARNGAGSTSADSDPTAVVEALPEEEPEPEAPASTGPPVVAGDAVEGGRLVGTAGSWSGEVDSHAYAWLRCDGSGDGCEPIAGADTNTHAPRAADVGRRLRLRVTATGPGGTAVAESEPTPVVAAAPRAPSVTSRPTVSGTPVEGETLTGTRGAWTEDPTGYEYRWRRCAADGSGCEDIGGATGQTYDLTADDAAHRIVLRVTASNAVGGTSADSDPTAAVQGLPDDRAEDPDDGGDPPAAEDPPPDISPGPRESEGGPFGALPLAPILPEPPIGPAGPAVAPPPGDLTAPRLTVRPLATTRAALRRGARVALTCSERCSVDVRLVLPRDLARRAGLARGRGRAVAAGSLTADLRGARSKTVRLELNSAGRTALAKLERARFDVVAVARDAVGNRSKPVTKRLVPRR